MTAQLSEDKLIAEPGILSKQNCHYSQPLQKEQQRKLTDSNVQRNPLHKIPRHRNAAEKWGRDLPGKAADCRTVSPSGTRTRTLFRTYILDE